MDNEHITKGSDLGSAGLQPSSFADLLDWMRLASSSLNLTESQLSPPTMKILNKIPSIK